MKKEIINTLLVGGLLLILSFMYLSPGGGLLLAGDKAKVMSDGTDPTTLPFQYELIASVAKKNFFHLFYGAVPNQIVNAPEGSAAWISWSEKIPSYFLSQLFPVEQVSTALVIFLLVANGLCFYLFARGMKWPQPIAIALSICWAFNPFTRARAKVHMAMAGIYHVPLIFLGLILLKKWPNKKGILLASLCFLFASMTLHYFLIMSAVLLPFMLIFYFWDKPDTSNLKKASLNLVLSGIPAVVFTAWCFFQPLPQSMIENNAQVLPKTGETTPHQKVHPFLIQFGAHFVDYFAGDTAIGTFDINPLRRAVTHHIHKNLHNSNPHERTNGIRWSIWIIVCLVISVLLFKITKFQYIVDKKKYYWSFLLLAGASFLLSLSPMLGGSPILPAAWVHSLIPQFRVPSRAGIFVHFSFLAISGTFLTNWLYQSIRIKNYKSSLAPPPTQWRPKGHSWAKKLTIPFILPLIAIIDFPPFMNKMPVAQVAPELSPLTELNHESCGEGMYFPYVSGTFGLLEFYYFIQRMRGTGCQIINSSESNIRNQKMLRRFPLHPQVLKAIKAADPRLTNTLTSFVRCTGLDYIVFDRKVPSSWRHSTCKQLGWNMTSKEICQSPRPQKGLLKLPENCL